MLSGAESKYLSGVSYPLSPWERVPRLRGG